MSVMLQKFNERYFESCYPDYRLQNPPGKTAWYRMLLKKWVGENAAAPQILDAGCGPGLLLETLPASWERYGADPAYDVMQKNRLTTNGVCYCGADIEHLPFSQCFTAVTAFDVLEHTGSPDAAAMAVNSVLLPEGIFIFAVPVIDGPAGLLVRLLDKDPTHRHLLSRHDWLAWTSRHFTLLWWCGITRYLFFKRWYLHLPTRTARHFTPAILVVARKKIALPGYETTTIAPGGKHATD